jgi:hypothetical protein
MLHNAASALRFSYGYAGDTDDAPGPYQGLEVLLLLLLLPLTVRRANTFTAPRCGAGGSDTTR